MKNATKDVIKSYYGEGGRRREGRNVDDALTSSAGKKARVSLGSNGRKKEKKERGEKVRVLFLDTFHFAAAAAANCNRATTQQRQTAASCQVVILRLGEEQTWTKLKPV